MLLALHKLFPKAPLYTSIYDRKKTPWADAFDPSAGSAQGVKTSFVQNLPFATKHELYAVLMPIAFESFSFDEYDLVISVTSEAAKGIITKPNTMHICYCLTPTRYLWSGYKEYFRNPFFSFFSKPAVSYLRSWDKVSAQRPDAYVAISKEVQRRIKRYYGRESIVVYPPLGISNNHSLLNRHSGERSDSRISFPKSLGRTERFWTSQNDDKKQNKGYFLIVSRLVPYKRIDIAIRAFNKLKLPLKIVGSGSEDKKLRSIANSNIEFLGYLTERELVRYYKDCRALIFPGIEDFGLTALEAQSFGKPVIAFRGGGALETIIEGKTGEFFYPQNEEALIEKVKDFRSSKYDPMDCIKNAERFSFERFKREFMRVVKYENSKHQIPNSK